MTNLPTHYTVSLLIAASLPLPAAAQTEPGIPQVDIRGSAAGYDARRDDTATRIIIKRGELTRDGDRSILDALQSNKKFLYLRLHYATKWHILARPVQ